MRLKKVQNAYKFFSLIDSSFFFILDVPKILYY